MHSGGCECFDKGTLKRSVFKSDVKTFKIFSFSIWVYEGNCKAPGSHFRVSDIQTGSMKAILRSLKAN